MNAPNPKTKTGGSNATLNQGLNRLLRRINGIYIHTRVCVYIQQDPTVSLDHLSFNYPISGILDSLGMYLCAIAGHKCQVQVDHLVHACNEGVGVISTPSPRECERRVGVRIVSAPSPAQTSLPPRLVAQRIAARTPARGKPCCNSRGGLSLGSYPAWLLPHTHTHTHTHTGHHPVNIIPCNNAYVGVEQHAWLGFRPSQKYERTTRL